MRFLDVLLRCKAPRSLASSTAATLRSMSERELSDLGIGRSEIPALLAVPRPQARPVGRPLWRRLPA